MFSLWCSQAEALNPLLGPQFLARGQQAGLEGTKGFLHPPSLPGAPGPELPPGWGSPSQPCCTEGAPSGRGLCPSAYLYLSPPRPMCLSVSVLSRVSPSSL